MASITSHVMARVSPSASLGLVTTSRARPAVGPLLRAWRTRRRLSQLELATRADVSTRHVSFIETSRAQPSRDMLLHLAEHLEVPLRERNTLLLAAGFAPAYAEHGLDSPRLRMARRAIRKVLRGHEPYPAVVVDRHWNVLERNTSVGVFLDGVAPDLLAPPVNVLRISLHPRGMAPRIVNLAEWRGHLLARLRRQVDLTSDTALASLYEELLSYPGGPPPPGHAHAAEVVVPLRITHEGRQLSFLSTVATFGTPVDITLAEVAIESFFPVDEETSAVLRQRADAAR